MLSKRNIMFTQWKSNAADNKMSVLIDKIRVAGFRGLSDLEVSLPRVCVLIGKNNSGKTSVLKSLQLALGDYARFLSEEDFYIDKDDNSSEKILVDVRIIAIDEDGKRKNEFSGEWLEEFGDKVQSEPDGKMFVAIRTMSEPDKIKGGFATTRFSLEKWPEREKWKEEKTSRKNQINKRFEALPYFSVDAQRDIHLELKDKSSFVGKVLSNVKYEKDDISKIEEMISSVNSEAVTKSSQLQDLKTQLENLNHSFQSTGKAEITPFPKKMRDLSKQFTVHFGEDDTNSFSMEYHGMGTRSWASMLTVKAFTESLSVTHKKEEKPFYPILAAEEPEAHLHPNAQRTIYNQLVNSRGQVIISTHSPYLAALAKQTEIKALNTNGGNVEVRELNNELGPEEKRKIQREVIHSRGELFFSKGIVLMEGETEEQALPQLFSRYFDLDPFVLGVNFIGVGGSGAKYKPFLSFAFDFGIPVFVFSDGESDIKKKLKKAYDSVFGESEFEKCPNITLLDGTDFEGYLLNNGYESQIEDAIKEVDESDKVVKWIEKRVGTPMKPKKVDGDPCVTCKQPKIEVEYRDYTGVDGKKKAIIEILDSHKSKYSQAVAEQLVKLEPKKLPPKIIEFFEKIRKGMSL